MHHFNCNFTFYHITGITSLRYINIVLVNKNNFINNGSTIIFCIIWNHSLQFLVFVSCLTKTATRRKIGWVGHSNKGKGEMITKCWSGKGMKRPVGNTRVNTRVKLQLIFSEKNIYIHTHTHIYIYMCVCVCAWGRERESHGHCIQRNETVCGGNFLEYLTECQLVKKTCDTRNKILNLEMNKFNSLL